MSIHPTAVVDPEAEIGPEVSQSALIALLDARLRLEPVAGCRTK